MSNVQELTQEEKKTGEKRFTISVDKVVTETEASIILGSDAFTYVIR